VKAVVQPSKTAFQAKVDSMTNAPGTPYRSAVYGFTTDLPPRFDTVAFQDGGGQAIGTVTVPVPEPSAAVLLLCGLPLAAWCVLRRRRCTVQV
jgi:hypothetical protein